MTGDGLERVDSEPTQTNAADQDTFVVRVWLTGVPGVARGHVQHVRSRQSAYFANGQRLQTFIEEHLGTADAGGTRARPARRRDAEATDPT